MRCAKFRADRRDGTRGDPPPTPCGNVVEKAETLDKREGGQEARLEKKAVNREITRPGSGQMPASADHDVSTALPISEAGRLAGRKSGERHPQGSCW